MQFFEPRDSTTIIALLGGRGAISEQTFPRQKASAEIRHCGSAVFTTSSYHFAARHYYDAHVNMQNRAGFFACPACYHCYL